MSAVLRVPTRNKSASGRASVYLTWRQRPRKAAPLLAGHLLQVEALATATTLLLLGM